MLKNVNVGRHFWVGAFGILLGIVLSNPVEAQVTVFNDQAQFELTTGAVMVPIPDSQTAIPGTMCGVGDIGPTGIGAQVDIAFDSNSVIS